MEQLTVRVHPFSDIDDGEIITRVYFLHKRLVGT